MADELDVPGSEDRLRQQPTLELGVMRKPVVICSFGSLLQQALREHDFDDLLHRLQACPVALQLAR